MTKSVITSVMSTLQCRIIYATVLHHQIRRFENEEICSDFDQRGM
jgi:hypothetical protein